MKSEKPLVEIKGFGGTLGLLIDHTSDIDQIEDEIIKILQRPNSKQFFQGAEIILQGSGRQLSSDEFSRLEILLQREGDLHLKTQPEEVRVLPQASKSPETAPLFAFLPPEPKQPQDAFDETTLFPASPEDHLVVPDPVVPELETAAVGEALLEKSKGLKTADALMVRQTLHSGQNIRSEASVLLMGDVNAGAEIVSEQDVIVLGTIRGMVHAGASGNRRAVVFALRMQPTQLRIAELITQPPAEDKKAKQLEPEIAFIEENSIIIETCRKIRL